MAEIKALGRRLFAKATMGVPLALRDSSGTVPHPSAWSRPPSIGMEAVDPGPAQSIRSRIWDAISKARRTTRQTEQFQDRRAYLMGGLDPDISVLNSTSVVWRIHKQMDREKGRQEREDSLRSRIIRSLGGNPEEFE